MAKKAPGKHFRKGLSLVQVFKRFPDNATAEKWLAGQRWPNGVSCPHCGSSNVQTGAKHKTMPYRCREKTCEKRFSTRTGTVLESSNLGYQVWVIAMYLLSTNLKGVSSMKLHRDLNITQKSAWHLAHRLREGLGNDKQKRLFSGPVEVDETYFGGKEKNKHNSKKLRAGRGAVGKTAVIGAKDRDTNAVSATVIHMTDQRTFQDFVTERTERGATVYTDDHGGYNWLCLDFEHESVKHSVREYVRDQAHTNGIESFWSVLKRGYYGIYHRMSAKHLDRYVNEFSGRHNIRGLDTMEQMSIIARGLDRKRLRYKDLVAEMNA